MNTEKYIGEKVEHISFGEGIISRIDDRYIIVDFEKVGEKQLQFPGAFSKFLSFLNEELQQEMVSFLAALEVKKKEEKHSDEDKTIEDRFLLNKLQIGDSFKTHDEALNDCFGFSYKHFQQAYKVIDGTDFAVWFPNIARRVLGEYVSTDHSLGWVNILSEQGNVLTQMDRDGDPQEAPSAKNDKFYKNRIVFAKFEGEPRYQFIGVFDKGVRIKDGIKFSRIGKSLDLRTMTIGG